MKKWVTEYSKYAFVKAKEWSNIAFSIIGFIGTFFGLIFSFNLLGVKIKPQLNIGQCLFLLCGTFALIFILTLCFAFIKVKVISLLLNRNPNNEKYQSQMAEIDSMRCRGLYVDKQICEIEKAKKSVLVSMHSLSDENKKKQYKRFNKALFDAQERNVEVKVLAPCGIERVKGAVQLNEIYHIEMRFANQLECEDLRFILVDGERAVFSQQKVPNTGLSSKFSEVQGKELGQMLKKYYMNVWTDEHTLDYKKFLIESTKGLFRSENDVDLDVAAKRMGIPKITLKEAFKGENHY